MNVKYWLLAATLISTACLEVEDDKEEEEEEESEPTSEPSEPTAEPAGEPSYAYITQNYTGSATVVAGVSYEGTETFSVGINDTSGTGMLSTEVIWALSGTAVDAPSECADCIFSFDVDLTFDAAASTDPDGSGSDMTFSYALGTSDYGTDTVFYGNDGEWGPWLTNGEGQADLAGTEHPQVVSFDGTAFSYDGGIVDFYYYY